MSTSSARSNDRIVHSTRPLNAEPSLAQLRDAFVTPVGVHYLRSHGEIPDVDEATYALDISCEGQRARLSLADLQSGFSARTLMAALQCAGNRRADLQCVEPTSGDPWRGGAIGNASWTGVPLANVLRASGVTDPRPDLHVAFEGLDLIGTGSEAPAPFGVSIPLAKAIDGDVLLAWAMNGAPLTREHGAPLRVVVPGFAGVRSVKWLAAVAVQDRPSDAHHQRHDYLLYPRDMRPETRDDRRGTVINEMPLNAAICHPDPGARVPAGRTIRIRGYAVANCATLARVDLSADGGQSWTATAIEDHGGGRWAWRFWHADLVLAPGPHELCVRAVDDCGHTQPASPTEGWNFKGYLCNAWHRVPVTAA